MFEHYQILSIGFSVGGTICYFQMRQSINRLSVLEKIECAGHFTLEVP